MAVNHLIKAALTCERERPRFAYIGPTYRQAKAVVWDYLKHFSRCVPGVEFKARMAIKLAVAGAFHTDFMAPAVPALEAVLKNVKVVKPRIPVVSNVDAKAHSDPDVIKSILTKQVTAPVQWETIMKNLCEQGFEAGYELGPGKVLSGIMGRVDKTKVITNIQV